MNRRLQLNDAEGRPVRELRVERSARVVVLLDETVALRRVVESAREHLRLGPTCHHAADGEHCDCYAPATHVDDDGDEWCDEHRSATAWPLPNAEHTRSLVSALSAIEAAKPDRVFHQHDVQADSQRALSYIEVDPVRAEVPR